MRVSTKIAIIIFSALLLFIGSLVNAYSFDYFPNNVDTLKEGSMICILYPPSDKKFYILKAINSWDYYMNTNWYKMKTLQIELPECDGTIVFDNPINIFDDTKNEFGVTKCWDSPILNQFGQNYTKSRYCRVAVNLDTTGHVWYQTLQHEMGHVLGLGHRLAFEAKDFPYLFLQHDMMFSNIDNQVTISDESIDALWYFRTYPQLEQNYTILHD